MRRHYPALALTQVWPVKPLVLRLELIPRASFPLVTNLSRIMPLSEQV